MVELRKECYPVMDLIKFVFCLFIVGIHTELFSENPEIHYWVEKGLFRLAVPYFVLCSGFLLAMKIDAGGEYVNIKHFSDKLLRMLLIFEPISIVLRIVIFTIERKSVVYIILRVVQSIIFYPYGALWYIQAMIVGIWLLYFIVLKMNNIKLGYYIGIPLFLIALVCNSYYFLIENTLLGKILNLYLKIAMSARNGVFYGFFVLWVGMVSYKVYKKGLMSHKAVLASFFVCYDVYLFELFCLKEKTMKDDGSIFIMSIPVALFLLFISVGYKANEGKTVFFRNLSTGVYLFHRPILYVLTIFQMITTVKFTHTVLFFIVAIGSIAICSIFYKGNFKISRYLK